jgi:hypothetical protein
MFFSVLTFGQEITITGTITDESQLSCPALMTIKTLKKTNKQISDTTALQPKW